MQTNAKQHCSYRVSSIKYPICVQEASIRYVWISEPMSMAEIADILMASAPFFLQNVQQQYQEWQKKKGHSD